MLRHLIYPFLPYRSMIAPILFVGAIAVPFWLLYRLYRRRTPGRRPSIGRELLLLLFVCYLSALAAVTLEPNRPSRAVAESAVSIQLRPSPAALTCSSTILPAGSRAQGFCMRNARGNALLFFPLGLLLPFVWPGLRFWRGLSIALAASIGIELLQYGSRAFGSERTADVNDVILNVAGAAIGLGLAVLARSRRPVRSRA